MILPILAISLLPAWEMQTIGKVCKDYSLTHEQKRLLISIRRSENGSPPFYYGVADKRCNTYMKQCRWAANTIRLRYDGDLEKFAARWCPLNWRVWVKNVRWFMKKQEK